MNYELQREFLYNAIGDSQETIHAIDSKIEMLLLFLIIPMTGLPELISQSRDLWAAHDGSISRLFIVGATVCFVVSWLLAFFCSFRALSSISNPVAHLRIPVTAKGTFYRGSEFPLSAVDAFMNRVSAVSKNTAEDVIAQLPDTEQAVLQELATEQLKLSYIRDIKIVRQRWAYRLAFTWLLIAMMTQTIAQLMNKSG